MTEDTTTPAHSEPVAGPVQRKLGLALERACTCHPDDKPPQPCAKQYALAECRAMSYATTLAKVLHAKHYAEVTQWKPLPDLLGVLTQIDNMTAGLVRPNVAGNRLAEGKSELTGVLGGCNEEHAND